MNHFSCFIKTWTSDHHVFFPTRFWSGIWFAEAMFNHVQLWRSWMIILSCHWKLKNQTIALPVQRIYLKPASKSTERRIWRGSFSSEAEQNPGMTWLFWGLLALKEDVKPEWKRRKQAIRIILHQSVVPDPVQHSTSRTLAFPQPTQFKSFCLSRSETKTAMDHCAENAASTKNEVLQSARMQCTKQCFQHMQLVKKPEVGCNVNKINSKNKGQQWQQEQQQ